MGMTRRCFYFGINTKEADKTALLAQLNAASALNEASYTAASWASMPSVVSFGTHVYNDPSTTQAVVDDAASDIANAISSLVPLTDKTALQAAINNANALVEAGYTPNSWAPMQSALTAANAVNADPNATQAQVDAATSNLNAAIAALVLRADKTALADAIADGNAYSDPAPWTPASYQALQDTIAAGQTVYNDANATQAQVDTAEQDIRDAITGLVAACQSCLGKWTGDIAASLGGQPFDIAGACGHELSLTAPAAGIYAASVAAPVTINWPATEARIYRLDISSLVSQDASLIGNTPPVNLGISPCFRRTSDGLVVASHYETQLDGVGVLVLLATTDNNISGMTGQPALSRITAPPAYVDLMLHGDGRVTYYSDGSQGTISAFSAGDQIEPFVETMLPAGNWTGDLGATIKTESSLIDVLPDNILDLTTISDLCGNVIQTRPADVACERPLEAFLSNGYFPVPPTVTGSDLQTVFFDRLTNQSGYHVAASVRDALYVDWPTNEVRGIQVRSVQFDGGDSGYSFWCYITSQTVGTAQEGNDFATDDAVIGVIGANNTDFIKKLTTKTSFDGVLFSQQEITATSGDKDNFFLGITGDGQTVAIYDGQYYKTNNPGSSFDTIRTIYMVCRTGTAAPSYNPEAQLISKAADMTIAIPDMSADGITTVADFCGNPVTSSGGGADKTALYDAIATANGLDSADYTSNSWNALQAALTAANTISNDPNATQAQVDAALADLNAAIAGAETYRIYKSAPDASQFLTGYTYYKPASVNGGEWFEADNQWFYVVQDLVELKSVLGLYRGLSVGASVALTKNGETHSIPCDNLITTLVTSLAFLTDRWDNFDQPIGSWDTSNVTSMNSTFSYVMA